MTALSVFRPDAAAGEACYRALPLSGVQMALFDLPAPAARPSPHLEVAQRPAWCVVNQYQSGTYNVVATFATEAEADAFRQRHELEIPRRDKRRLPLRSRPGTTYPIQARLDNRRHSIAHVQVIWDQELGIARAAQCRGQCKGCRGRMWEMQDPFDPRDLVPRVAAGPILDRCSRCR